MNDVLLIETTWKLTFFMFDPLEVFGPKHAITMGVVAYVLEKSIVTSFVSFAFTGMFVAPDSWVTDYYVAIAIHSTSTAVAADDDELLTTRISKPFFVMPPTYIAYDAKMAAAPALSPGDPLKHATTCGTDANSLGNVTDVIVVPLGFVWHSFMPCDTDYKSLTTRPTFT